LTKYYLSKNDILQDIHIFLNFPRSSLLSFHRMLRREIVKLFNSRLGGWWFHSVKKMLKSNSLISFVSSIESLRA